MFYKKQICHNCKTGKETYNLDRHSVFCSHIVCVKNGKCSFYKPIKRVFFFKKYRVNEVEENLGG